MLWPLLRFPTWDSSVPPDTHLSIIPLWQFLSEILCCHSGFSQLSSVLIESQGNDVRTRTFCFVVVVVGCPPFLFRKPRCQIFACSSAAAAAKLFVCIKPTPSPRLFPVIGNCCIGIGFTQREIFKVVGRNSYP